MLFPEDENERKRLEHIYQKGQNDAYLPAIRMDSFKEKIKSKAKIISILLKGQANIIRRISTEAAKNNYEEALTVGSLSIHESPEKEYMPKEIYEQTVKLPFGDELYDCPAGYETILKKQYGDYMQLPPKEKRVIPEIRSYWI